MEFTLIFLLVVFIFTQKLNQYHQLTRYDNELIVQEKISPEIHFYELALKRCHLSDQNWTIHGLWPQYTYKKWPAFCHKKAFFNHSVLEPIMDQLNNSWSSCWGRSTNYHFWRHEYLKHATCSPFDEFNYFNKTLGLYHWLVNYRPNVINEMCSLGSLDCMIPFNLNLTLRN